MDANVINNQLAETVEFNGSNVPFESEFVLATDNKVKGTLINRKGKVLVSFALPGMARQSAPLDEKWVLLQEAKSDNLLDAILTDESKKAKKGKANKSQNTDVSAQGEATTNTDDKNALESKETAIVPPAKTPLTEDEKLLLKTLEKDFRGLEKGRVNAEQKVIDNTFAQSKIAFEIQDKELWRETINPETKKLCKKFSEYIVNVLKVARQHGYLLANIGGFVSAFPEIETDDNLEFGIRSANRLVINQNKLATNMQLPDAPLSDFKPLLDQIIDFNKQVAMNDKTKMAIVSDKVVDKVADKVSTTLTDLFDYSRTDIIELATKKLKDNAVKIISESKTELAAKPEPKKVNPIVELSINDFDGFKFENGLLTLTDGRTFRQVWMS